MALVVIAPLVAFVVVSRRAARVRQGLGLPALTVDRPLVPVVALLLVAGLVGFAAAQPLLQRTSTRRVRADAEVFVVIDVTRSMLAQRRLTTPRRIDRAKDAATKLRASLPGVPVGIGSMTNRVLPHLFPSADQEIFRTTLARAIGIERPPPATGFILAPEQAALRNATSLTSLRSVADQRFFSPEARRRLLIVLTDGESLPVSASAVARSLRRAEIDTVFLHLWAADERVFTRGVAEPQYRPVPASRSVLDGLAAAIEGNVYDESRLDAAVRDARDVLGTGPTIVERDARRGGVALGPYLTATAFLPLAVLLWRRDR